MIEIIATATIWKHACNVITDDSTSELPQLRMDGKQTLVRTGFGETLSLSLSLSNTSKSL